jgi:2-iminobutanoate/2-iminopropanoate deaminase
VVEKKSVATDKAPRAIGPYSQAIVLDALVFCSGQVALDPESGAIVAGGVKEQTERVLANLTAVLEAAGSSLASVVRTTVFLKDMAHFAEMNEIYARVFGDVRPARSTVEVARLPKDALIEIDCIAHRR